MNFNPFAPGVEYQSRRNSGRAQHTVTVIGKDYSDDGQSRPFVRYALDIPMLRRTLGALYLSEFLRIYEARG